MMLTFQVKLEEIIFGRKITTIRALTPTRQKHWEKHSRTGLHQHTLHRKSILIEGIETLKLWWLNPRNKSPYCRKIGEGQLIGITMVQGKHLNRADAILDGFDSVEELTGALAKTGKLSRKEVLEATWLIYLWDHHALKFEPWVHPHPWNKLCNPNKFCPICKRKRGEVERVERLLRVKT